DDRITGRLDAFSPGSKKIHVDIDPSSINKNVKVDLPIIGDCGHVLADMLRLWRENGAKPKRAARNAVDGDAPAAEPSEADTAATDLTAGNGSPGNRTPRPGAKPKKRKR
ncbi:MAG: hypothetical protein WA488_18865, partial [Mycobacterium sp.]